MYAYLKCFVILPKNYFVFVSCLLIVSDNILGSTILRSYFLQLNVRMTSLNLAEGCHDGEPPPVCAVTPRLELMLLTDFNKR